MKAGMLSNMAAKLRMGELLPEALGMFIGLITLARAERVVH